MIVILTAAFTMSAFFLGRYTGQRQSEKINDTNRDILVGICDAVMESEWLSTAQREKLADVMISQMPVKHQRMIKEKTDALMKGLGLSAK